MTGQNDDSAPTQLGVSFSDALFDFLARYRSIRSNIVSFSRVVYFAEINDILRDLHIRKSILENFDEKDDDLLYAISSIEKIIAEKNVERNDFITKTFKSGAPENLASSLVTYESNGRYSIDGFTFLFSPSILPSSSSRSSEHSPNYSLINFLRSQLISLITEFELFLSKIVRAYFENYPGSLENKEVSIKLEEIKKFSNIADIKDHVVESEIHAFTMGGIEDWEKFLLEKFKIKLKEVTPKFEQFREIFIRRNLFVHNDGVVNKRYLDSNPNSAFKIGEIALISDDYIITSMEVLKIVATSICFMGWNHLSGKTDSKYIAAYLQDVGYIALKDKEWYLAERAYHHLDKYGNDEDKLIAKINNLICLNNTNRKDEVETILSSINYSLYNSKYIVGFAALKKDIDNLIINIGLADIEIGELMEWPVFQDVREEEKFKSYLKNKLLDEAITIAQDSKLETLSKNELTKIAKSQGIKIPKSLTKGDIVSTISENQRDNFGIDRKTSHS